MDTFELYQTFLEQCQKGGGIYSNLLKLYQTILNCSQNEMNCYPARKY